jgi:energy-coupling factor transporter ATP-binding protein EcfA2
VIKADDQEHILDEVVEYVVTNEISRKIRDFFAEYNDYRGANGVWISGFFGSGKSHLLKILSYILENKQYNGYRLGELFAEKIENDQMLKADIISATRIPSESVLFNIDQQAQNTGNLDQDSVLNVFYKVFNNHLGYFGTQKHVADFERWLDHEKVYHEFREVFENLHGEPWHSARRKYFDPRVKTSISQALGKVFNNPAENYSGIIDTLRKDAVVSVDDFCNKVKQYLDTKSAGFRLNFFVDEVGQFIGDDSKLMLNLQTIAETLATRTRGQSWVLVTSQEDMESVIGDLNSRQQNDFSRIQARFKLKVPLTSANVDEVIERRLLSKTSEATTLLKETWMKEKSSLETLLSFTELGIQFRGYHGDQDFVRKFPFIPYQFDLFQQSIKALSKHNAFQGRHASVGERSMLGVFQFVIQKLHDQDHHALVSFDLLFEGIRATIKGEIQNAITLAERQLDCAFALKVLKALFLVKYYTSFKTTSRNVSTLLLDSMKVDLAAHNKKVDEALSLLESQNYIQRNGDIYEYLTDDEKDIQEAIKQVEIDEQEITQLVKEILFDQTIRDTKFRFADNKQEYEYTPKVDGYVFSRDKELNIEVITPNHQNYGNDNWYKAQTLGYQTLQMLVLPPEDRWIKDLRMYLKTDKYIRRSQSAGTNETHRRILYEKSQQNLERKRNLAIQAQRLLGEAVVYMNGSRQDYSNTTDGRNKVFNAFQDLVRLAYPNLRMLGNAVYAEETVTNILAGRHDNLFGTADQALSQAELEVLNIIKRRKASSERTSLSDLKDYFSKKPYGWYPNAVWALTAMLFKKGKIEARQDSNLLNDRELGNAFFNNRLHINTLLEPQAEVDERKFKKLKSLYAELFDEPAPTMEARDFANAFKNKIQGLRDEIALFQLQKREYAFLSVTNSVLELLNKMVNREYAWFIENVDSFGDQLLDFKEDILTPLKRFWNGEQKHIYDQLKVFTEGNQSNLEFIDGDEFGVIEAAYQHPKPYLGDTIRQAKEAMDSLKGKLQQKIDQEKKDAVQRANEVRETISRHYDFAKLTLPQQQSVLKQLDDEIRRLESQRYIANIRQAAYFIGSELKTRLLTQIINLPIPVHTADDTGTPPTPRVKYIPMKDVRVQFERNELQTEADVIAYVDTLKKALLEQIKQNKRISI